jgi:hypothetical protein
MMDILYNLNKFNIVKKKFKQLKLFFNEKKKGQIVPDNKNI